MSSKEALATMANWVAAIADNVKNPIAGIGAVLDVVEANAMDPKIVEASIAQVRRRLADLNDYVTELAEFARPATIYPSAVLVLHLVEEAVRAAALPSSCVVTFDVSTGLVVMADRGKMAFAIRSVVRNAYEAVGVAEIPRLGIVARAAGGMVEIVVEDNGHGFAPSVIERAEEPFFSTKEAGTGLGLALVRKYVTAHHGTLDLQRSTALGGARVVIRLQREIPV